MTLLSRKHTHREQHAFAQAHMHADREARAHRNAHCVTPLKVATGIRLYVLAACVLAAEPRTAIMASSCVYAFVILAYWDHMRGGVPAC